MGSFIVDLLIYQVSILSATGSGFIIQQYYKLERTMAQNLILYLSIGDLLFSFSNMIYVDPDPGSQTDEKPRCQAQAYIRYITMLSTFFSSFFICLSLYQSVIKKKELTMKKQRIYLLFIFGLPILTGLIPLLTHQFKASEYSCGFSSEVRMEVQIESLLMFFLPMWITTTFSVFLIIKVFRFFRKVEGSESDEIRVSLINRTVLAERKEIQISKAVVGSVLMYPVIQAFCWMPCSVYQFLRLFNEETPAMAGLRFLLADSQGMLNAIAYYLSQKFIAQTRKEEEEKILDRRLSSVSSISEYYHTTN